MCPDCAQRPTSVGHSAPNGNQVTTPFVERICKNVRRYARRCALKIPWGSLPVSVRFRPSVNEYFALRAPLPSDPYPWSGSLSDCAFTLSPIVTLRAMWCESRPSGLLTALRRAERLLAVPQEPVPTLRASADLRPIVLDDVDRDRQEQGAEAALPVPFPHYPNPPRDAESGRLSPTSEGRARPEYRANFFL